MSKVSIIELDNINTPGAVTSLNTNFTRLQTAIENTLSRDGTVPNFMGANLDMNGYNIINVGEISNSDTPVSSGGGSAGGSFGLTFDGETDQTVALNNVFETYSYVKLLPPSDATGALRIDGTVDVPDNCVLDISAVDIDFGAYGRIYPQGSISELPGDDTPNIRFAQAAEAGDTTIYLNLVDADNASLVVEDALLIIRGENDSAGVAIDKEEKRVQSVTVTGSLTRTVVLDAPLEFDYELEYPDSAHTPEGGGPDRSLITVAVGSLLTSNVAMYDRVIPVVDGTIFAVNDRVMVRSDALVIPDDPDSIPYGEEPNVIESISSNNITLARPIGRPFLTADGAGLYKLDTKRVTIIGGSGTLRTVETPPTSRRIDFVGGQYLYNSYFKNISVNSTGQTYDKKGAGVAVRRSINTVIEEPRIIGRANTGSGDGNGVFVVYSIGTIVLNPYVERCRHGVILQGGVYNLVHHGHSNQCYTNGFDFHGAGETASGFLSCVAIGGSTTAPDSSVCGGMTVGNTRWRGDVTDCFVNDYHAIGFEDTDYFGITVRAPVSNVLIQNSTLTKCSVGIRLAIDDRAGAISIDGVTLRNIQYTSCDTDLDVSDNEAPAWSASQTIDTATAIRPRYRTYNSKLYKTEAGGITGGTPPTHSSGTVSDGTLDWTYVAVSANRITNTVNSPSVAGTEADWRNLGGGDLETLLEATTALQTLAEAGGSNNDVELDRSQLATKTASFTLTTGLETVREADNTITLDQINKVSGASAPVNITLSSAPDVGTTFLIDVIDLTNPVTLVRETPEIQRLGDLDETVYVVLDDVTDIENGDTVTGTGIPGSTTVVDNAYAENTIEISQAATITDTEVALTFTDGKKGSINNAATDLSLDLGLTSVVLLNTTDGAVVSAGGNIKSGVAPVEIVSVTATGNTDIDSAHLGRWVVVTSASGDPTYTVLTEANADIDFKPGTTIEFYWDGTADSFTFVQGSGVTLNYPATQTLAMIAKGMATLKYLGSEAWVLSGALVGA